MATTNSSNESAPDKFQISTETEEKKKKCLVCNTSRKYFYCPRCVRIGDFVHTHNSLSERFSEKQSRYRQQKEINRKLEQQCEHFLVKSKLSENFRSKIKQKHRNIEILTKLIEQKKEQNIKYAEDKKTLQDYNGEMLIKLPRYADKVYRLEDYVTKRQDDIGKRKERYTEVERELNNRIRVSINQLIQFVFPISRVITRSQDTQQQSEEIVEIAEATRTAYVRGRWVQLQDSHSELQYIIVAPSLPGTGDYTSYNDWVAANKDVASQPSSNEVISNQNCGYRISAALTFTAQLLQILSYYLNVRLPYKMTYGDYFTSDMPEQKFTRRVAKLNANVLYLCYTQKVKLKQLKPNQTLQNIQTILNTDALVKCDTYVNTSDCLAESVDSMLVQELEIVGDSESDDENTIPNEWENVSNTTSYEHQMQLAGGMGAVGPGMVANQQSTLMTSAAASIASFWRGWTGK